MLPGGGEGPAAGGGRGKEKGNLMSDALHIRTTGGGTRLILANVD